MKKNKVLFTCAHPDDEVLGCGGIISKMIKQGHKIKIIFISEGITARYEKKDFENKKVKNEIIERNNNSIEALEYLGVNKKNIIFYNHPCCRLDTKPLIDITKIIEREISVFKPDIVYTHNKDDVNIDHKVCFDATLAACRPTKENSIKKIFTFEVLSSTEWNPNNTFTPQVFEDITDFIDFKINSLKKYKKELMKSPHSRSIEKVLAIAAYRGSFIGVKYAEAFQLIRQKCL